MAESAVHSVLQKLPELLIQESVFLYGVSEEVEWLQRELRWMNSFLKDAESKRRGNQLIINWLREVREVAHQAEDIIDTFNLEIEIKKTQKRGILQHFKWMECLLYCLPCELISRHKVGTEIIGLKAKIDHIEKSRVRYGLVSLDAETTPSAADEALQARRKIHPHDSNTLVVGLDVHKKKIVDHLLNPDVKRLSVVSIVGTGGLGKTTLANKIYNDNEIKAKFDAFACISVSQDFKVLEIYTELVKQMKVKTMDELKRYIYTVDELGEMLREFLMQRRYIIVLDDVWSEDVWDRLIREALPEEYNGSRVLLTTRIMDVATSIDRTIPPYELPILNEDDSWALFLNKAFLPDESCSEELEGIGRRLVKRCGGLPLALEVLGGILSSKKPNSVAWTSVAEHFQWGSTDRGGDCSKILGLSYDNLPHHHLKSCFLYLGVFPEDSKIEARELIELWIAEGFIPHSETQLMEDTAQAYLEELADRSMIQVVRKNWLGSSASVLSLRIHDLFRDLCIREAREEDFFNIYNTTSNSSTTLQDSIKSHGKNLRRLVVHGDISTSADFMPPRNLKSILQFGKTGEAPPIIITNGLKLLRVIHFICPRRRDNRNDEKFPEMFDKMITNTRHLRYLRLSGNFSNLGSLPPSFRNLCNLQTLDFFGSEVSVLPDWLGEIRTLRHFYLFRFSYSGVSCSADVGSLTNLQTLEGIDAGGGWMERSLEKLVNIRYLYVRNLREEQGRVFIDSLRKMKYLSFFRVADVVIPIEILSVLSENTHLSYMYLVGTTSVPKLPAESHGFPPNLTMLDLRLSNLSQDPMATLEKLPYLRTLILHVRSYRGKEMVCTSGGFPRLHELGLRWLEELEEWMVEDGAMPNLTVLTISQCSKLMTLPGGLQHLRSLQTLELSGYSAEDRVRREVGEDWYKIQHVPQIRLDGKQI